MVNKAHDKSPGEPVWPGHTVSTEVTRLLATSTPSLVGWKTGYMPFHLKRQPCMFNIPRFPSAYV